MSTSKRTIRCSMVHTPAMDANLTATCAAFADACTATLALAAQKSVSNNIALHHLAYGMIRERFGLSANLAVRVVRRVSVAMTAAKATKKPPRRFEPTSIDYDARIFAYRAQDETVSLTVVGGRIHVPLRLGTYQRTALTGKRPTAATVVKKGREWHIHIVVEDDDDSRREGPPVGVDLGIRNTAATSLGVLYPGQERQAFKAERQRIRSSLQSKGTRGATVVLRRLAGAEQRRIRHENHELSRRLVDETLKAHAGVIRLERLTGIRQRTRVWNKHSNRFVAGWSFGQLQAFVAYKAKRAGLGVEYVNPYHTSKECSRCHAIGERRADVFRCTACGLMLHADLNAARNIAAGGAACRPARIDRSQCRAS